MYNYSARIFRAPPFLTEKIVKNRLPKRKGFNKGNFSLVSAKQPAPPCEKGSNEYVNFCVICCYPRPHRHRPVRVTAVLSHETFAAYICCMEKRIHQRQLRDIMERRVNGRPAEFSLQYCKRSTGELVDYPRAVLTSWHSDGSTVNVLPAGETSPRKIRRCLITRINGLKVYF